MDEGQLPVAASEDEVEDLGELLSIRVQDVNQFETAFSEKVSRRPRKPVLSMLMTAHR
jgi:hypothetical protein